jgi:hypothetical protein
MRRLRDRRRPRGDHCLAAGSTRRPRSAEPPPHDVLERASQV